MNKKLKDTDSKKTKTLSNRLTVLKSEFKSVIKTAFTKINKLGKIIDDQETLIRNKMLELKIYEIENFNTNKAEETEAKQNIYSLTNLINECYEMAGVKKEEKQEHRGSYFHESVSITAKSVILLINAMLFPKEHRIYIHNSQTPLVTRIGKDKKQKTYRIMFDDLYCDYNYLKPNISYYDKTEEKTVSEPNTIDTKIPLNKEGIKKIYSRYYSNKQENNEDLPEAIDTVDGFISYVSGVSNQFALWTNGSIEAEQILASYTIEPKMIKELSGLENMINNFKTKAKLLEARDTPTDKELKSMGVINPAELVKLKNKLASK